MNYLKQLTCFARLDKEYSFTPLEIAIYMHLLWKCNDLSWKNPFRFGCDELRAKVKTTNKDSKKAFDTARNRLKQAGLFDFQKGNGRGNYTLYTLFDFEKEGEKGGQNAPLSGSLSVPLSGSQGGYINKYKVKETKESESVDALAQLKELQENFSQLQMEHQALLERRKKKPPPQVAAVPPSSPQLRIENPFSAPTIEEVSVWYTECTGINGKQAYDWAKHFVAKYDATGWVMGENRVPIVDWKKVVQVWIYREKPPAGGTDPQKTLRLKRRSELLYLIEHTVLTQPERQQWRAWANSDEATAKELEKAIQSVSQLIAVREQELHNRISDKSAEKGATVTPPLPKNSSTKLASAADRKSFQELLEHSCITEKEREEFWPYISNPDITHDQMAKAFTKIMAVISQRTQKV